MNELHSVSVQILDKRYHFRCQPQQQEALTKAALLLDANMRKLRDAQPNANAESMTINAALNICHELLELKQQQEQTTANANKKIKLLCQKISEDLTQREQIEL